MSELSEGSGLLLSGAGSPCLLGIGLGARLGDCTRAHALDLLAVIARRGVTNSVPLFRLCFAFHSNVVRNPCLGQLKLGDKSGLIQRDNV